jgi:hypothetical protein
MLSKKLIEKIHTCRTCQLSWCHPDHRVALAVPLRASILEKPPGGHSPVVTMKILRLALSFTRYEAGAGLKTAVDLQRNEESKGE